MSLDKLQKQQGPARLSCQGVLGSLEGRGAIKKEASPPEGVWWGWLCVAGLLLLLQ